MSPCSLCCSLFLFIFSISFTPRFQFVLVEPNFSWGNEFKLYTVNIPSLFCSKSFGRHVGSLSRQLELFCERILGSVVTRLYFSRQLTDKESNSWRKRLTKVLLLDYWKCMYFKVFSLITNLITCRGRTRVGAKYREFTRVDDSCRGSTRGQARRAKEFEISCMFRQSDLHSLHERAHKKSGHVAKAN